MNKNDFKNILISNVKLKQFLKENRLFLKKRFGQNFLFDQNIIAKIIKSIPFEKEKVIEIGPGIGNLTLFYYELPEQLYLIEIDKGLKNILQSLFADDGAVTLIHKDILKFDLHEIIKPGQKYVIISNLPYNIASQILIKMLDYYDSIKEFYLMAPEIYYKKFISSEQKFNDKLSVLLNLFFKIEYLFPVSRNSFFPVPEIDSVFMKFIPEKKLEDIGRSRRILSLLFAQKRKKLKKVLERSENRNYLSGYYDKRIEELNLDEIMEIINKF